MTGQADIDALLAEAESLVEETEAQLQESAPSASPAPAGKSAPASQEAPGRLGLRPDIRRILRIKVPFIVRLAEKPMPLSKIVNISTGSVIEFEKSADDPLELMTNNKRIGYGSAVKVGENFGVRVTSIKSVKGKLEAMRSS